MLELHPSSLVLVGASVLQGRACSACCAVWSPDLSFRHALSMCVCAQLGAAACCKGARPVSAATHSSLPCSAPPRPFPAWWGLLDGLVSVLCGAAVGAWVDSQPRLVAASRMYLLQNSSLAASAAAALGLLWSGVRSGPLFWAGLAVTMAAGSASTLGALGSTLSGEGGGGAGVFGWGCWLADQGSVWALTQWCECSTRLLLPTTAANPNPLLCSGARVDKDAVRRGQRGAGAAECGDEADRPDLPHCLPHSCGPRHAGGGADLQAPFRCCVLLCSVYLAGMCS